MIYLSNVTWIHDLAEQWTSKVKWQYDDWWKYDDSMGKERVKLPGNILTRIKNSMFNLDLTHFNMGYITTTTNFLDVRSALLSMPRQKFKKQGKM